MLPPIFLNLRTISIGSKKFESEKVKAAKVFVSTEKDYYITADIDLSN